jgi:hypothetical protein
MCFQALAAWQMTDLRRASRGDDGDAGRHPDGEGGDDNPGNNLGDCLDDKYDDNEDLFIPDWLPGETAVGKQDRKSELASFRAKLRKMELQQLGAARIMCFVSVFKSIRKDFLKEKSSFG